MNLSLSIIRNMMINADHVEWALNQEDMTEEERSETLRALRDTHEDRMNIIDEIESKIRRM